ncbi:MAG: YdiU family protein [Acidobacteriaceae bacterium]|nr:YdiU family protein [Acidobacteriaceae bacterium]
MLDLSRELGFRFDNSYARDLPGCYAPAAAAPAPAPRLIAFNQALARELGLNAAALDSPVGAEIFSGNYAPPGSTPLAQAYAGHQFGHFVPQLGDGRALLLGELIDTHGQRRDIQFKGSGRTPFSRGGDGKAALGPVLREYILGEAMHALGIPTTRALAAAATGESVYRESPLPGAVLTRVAASHIRVGTFQFFAARGDTAKLKQLADYTIARHYPALAAEANPYLALLAAVSLRQAELIARWMLTGFIHGVMNTDNMAISGETIDYGPCAFLDTYHPATVFSSIDHRGRYAYGQQPSIARWNLTRFAETLLPLIDADPQAAIAPATAVLEEFATHYDAAWLAGMRAKLGLLAPPEPADLALANSFLSLLETHKVDYTRAFRALSAAARGDDAPLRALFSHPAPLDAWAPLWRARLADPAASARAMDAVNPLYIPRNHLVEAALAAAVERDDLAPFTALLDVLAQPFTPRPGLEPYTEPAPPGSAPYRTFCGT